MKCCCRLCVMKSAPGHLGWCPNCWNLGCDREVSYCAAIRIHPTYSHQEILLQA